MFTSFKLKCIGNGLNTKNWTNSIPHCGHEFVDQLTWRQVGAQHHVTSVAPWTGINRHSVFPFMLNQMSGVVPIATRVEVAMVTRDARSPAVVCHYCVFHRAKNKTPNWLSKVIRHMHLVAQIQQWRHGVQTGSEPFNIGTNVYMPNLRQQEKHRTCHCRARRWSWCCSSSCPEPPSRRLTRSLPACTSSPAHTAPASSCAVGQTPHTMSSQLQWHGSKKA